MFSEMFIGMTHESLPDLKTMAGSNYISLCLKYSTGLLYTSTSKSVESGDVVKVSKDLQAETTHHSDGGQE